MKKIISLEVYEDKTFVFKCLIPGKEREIKGKMDLMNSVVAALLMLLMGAKEAAKELKEMERYLIS